MRGFDSYLTFQKLEVFCTVVELGSVTRAAAKLCVTQPVITAHLRGMEARLGYALVKRSGRQLGLTDAGERVYRWASDVITHTREIERELAGLEQGQSGRATIAASMSIGSYALPPIIADFHHLHTDGLVTVQISSPPAAIDAIRIGSCDFAILLLDSDQNLDGLIAAPLWEEDLVLVAGRQSYWATQAPQDIDLRNTPFVSAPRNVVRRELEEKLLRQCGLDQRTVVLEFGHPEAMKYAVRQGIGLSFLLESSVRDDVMRGELVVLNRPELSIKVPCYLVHRANKYFSTFQAELIEFIRKTAW